MVRTLQSRLVGRQCPARGCRGDYRIPYAVSDGTRLLAWEERIEPTDEAQDHTHVAWRPVNQEEIGKRPCDLRGTSVYRRRFKSR
jgi:hypothetical protein